MSPLSQAFGRAEEFLASYAQRLAAGAAPAARDGLLTALSLASEQDSLECARALVLRGDLETARAVFAAAAMRHPDAAELQLGLAGLYWQMQQPAQAESLLREWLQGHPADTAATFLLVRLLREQGRMNAAARLMLRLFEHGPHDVDTVIQAVELLDDYSRPQEALQICEAALAAGPQDARLHAYAGMLGIQLGQFERVREHYRYVLDHEPQAVEWNIPIGLSGLQRYRDGEHPDFALFREVLQRPGLSDKARTQLLFALGKAHDDLGDYAQAAAYWREANGRASADSSWSRKLWQRSIEARLAAGPYPLALAPASDWTPIFVVGVPRSGTTLLAELLARQPGVVNRGELGWLQSIAQRLSLAPSHDHAAYEQAAALYTAQLHQDDTEASWFIDKQPLNLLHVDLIMALWPHARIIHCQRDARDTALSLWSQSFHDRAHDYAYDFQHIAAVIQGCRRLMAHWNERYAASIRTIRYEDLVGAPDDSIADLAMWLGMPAATVGGHTSANHGIATASAWQARQPVYTRSAGRWRDYAPYEPELLKIPER
ncbi:tetratricopeptide repeat-containing sulfotransferase family protein [Dyella soli]|uniref:Sulfotransferase family protein n=1 Tax=Dyella soli TaxID=522319 RepID=A0A4V2NM18_9GAMM|nr:tetratricopeptide repeat-containing sulfotransferase family protein [Dyella soli]TCI11251.1 sulfotransferase family protein [Dyella soli]